MNANTEVVSETQLSVIEPLCQRICASLKQEIARLKLEQTPSMPRFEDLEFSTTQDPALGYTVISGSWKNVQGYKAGFITFNHDGSFFAEYDVSQVHPQKKGLFIESVQAWGRDGRIMSDVSLLEMPGD